MKTFLRRKNSRAFTLIELLVVVAIILIIASLLLPVVAKARRMAQMLGTANNGAGIVKSIVIEDLDSFARRITASYLPQGTTPYANSTAYFNAMMTNGVLEVTSAFFAAPGVSSGSPNAPLVAVNNAWCIAHTLNGLELGETPVLVTQNVAGSVIPAASATVPQVTLTPAVNPFGKDGCVVVRLDGSAQRLLSKDLTIASIVNPTDKAINMLRP